MKWPSNLRLDFFLSPGDPNYDKYRDTPFHSHFIYPERNASDADIKAEIQRTLNYFYAFHQHCWDKRLEFINEWKKVPSKSGQVRCPFIKGEPKDVSANQIRITDIINRKDKFQIGVSKVPSQDLNIGEKGTIDIGSGAVDGASTFPTEGYTLIDETNPANAAGTIDTFEIWANTDLSGAKIGTFYGSSPSYTNRDGETIGSVTSGSKQEFTSLSCDVTAGDFIGIYSSSGYLETGSTSDIYYKSGDQFGAGQQSYSSYGKKPLSIYGTGTEGGATSLELRSSTDTGIRLALETGITLTFRSSTDTNARLAISVAISIAGKAISNTRADLEFSALVALAFKSSTDTRASVALSVTAATELSLRTSTDTSTDITLDTLIALAFKSSGDTRASLALTTLVSLEMHSSTSTRAAIALTISLLIELQLRSATATRAAVQLNSVITLALLSQTTTRAALLLTTAFRYQEVDMLIRARELTMAIPSRELTMAKHGVQQ